MWNEQDSCKASASVLVLLTAAAWDTCLNQNMFSAHKVLSLADIRNHQNNVQGMLCLCDIDFHFSVTMRSQYIEVNLMWWYMHINAVVDVKYYLLLPV